MDLVGLHHVTAITSKAAQNVAFYTNMLGMRMVKKTVNQDDVSAYHLFYADALGSPGTDLTFFDWSQVPLNRNGAGSIAPVGLRVAGREALEWWADRLNSKNIPHNGIVSAGEYEMLQFADPEGLDLLLINDHAAPGGVHWENSPVPAEYGIRGLHSVTLKVQVPEQLEQVLIRVLGFKQTGEYRTENGSNASVMVFSTGDGGPGTEVHVETGPQLPFGRQGAGGVHHVAFRTPNDEEQLAWRERIAMAGLNITPVIDRFYFKSIYFRVPEGILFEIATDGPGFHADEDIEHLGERLALPPFLETHRREIEAQLRPL